MGRPSLACRTRSEPVGEGWGELGQGGIEGERQGQAEEKAEPRKKSIPQQRTPLT